MWESADDNIGDESTLDIGSFIDGNPQIFPIYCILIDSIVLS